MLREDDTADADMVRWRYDYKVHHEARADLQAALDRINEVVRAELGRIDGLLSEVRAALLKDGADRAWLDDFEARRATAPTLTADQIVERVIRPLIAGPVAL